MTGFLAIVLLVIVILVTPCHSSEASKDSVSSFFDSLVGEWVGKCEESVDGEKNPHKYFQVKVKESKKGVFESQFKYYSWNSKEKKAEQCGEMSFTTSVKPCGEVENKIKGKGSVYFAKKQRPKEYSLTETLATIEGGKIQGTGSGKINVSDMPFNLGSNGTLQKTKTIWKNENNTLSMEQNLNAHFSVLFFSKVFSFKAKYTASKGSDLEGFIRKDLAARK